jgi:hypothetical protein
MDLEIGAEVRTKDGAEVGHVHRVVIDLEQRAVVSVVVLKGHLLPRDILVPLDFIERADGGRVTLRLTRDELEHLPDFAYNRFFTPPPTWAFPVPYPGGAVYIPVSQRERLSASQEDLTPGTKVHAKDGEVGTVDRIESDAMGHLDAFWVRPGPPLAHDLRIPVEWVERLDDAGVHLAAGRAEIEARLAHESLVRRNS